ncbi:MAG: class I SAM-dependent methyltransferase [Nocardioides sp.]
MKVRVDQDGITVPPRTAGAFDVLFDGEPVWSFTVDGSHRARGYLVRWPRALRRWLDGYADITLREVGPADGGEPRVIEVGRVSFGSGDGQIRLVDSQDRPVVIDKWGIMQRPFSSRGTEVTQQLGECTRQVIQVLHEDCGIDAWLAFGTLLGAARAGKAIGHDSDSDLLYLSERSTPAEIIQEIYGIQRAFARRGLATTLKSGSFVTVLFPGPDGAPLGIDVYACFYVGDVLHETATLREPIPREAILPLSSMEFEGIDLPAPADPATLLAASYGPGWQVPDPSFRHEPDQGTVARFDGWFGNMMTARRGWESWWNHHREVAPASDLAQRMMADHPDPVSVLEVGAGNGSDAVGMAERGHRVNAYDFARHSFGAAHRHSRAEGLPTHFGVSNLYDLRDSMTLGALQLRRPRPPRVFFARFVIGSFHVRGQEAFWRLLATVLRGGGRAYLEFTDEPDPDRDNPQRLYPLRFQVDADDVRRRVEQAGGRVVLADRESRAAPDLGRHRPSWHLVAEWT